MKVLIVDDSIHKIDTLSKYINLHSPNSFIDTAESITNALKTIKDKELIYNLIIIDQYLPQRNGENPIPDGGKKLLLEINRTLKNKIPNYIIGFSQYDNSDVEFSMVWKIIKFEIDSTDWQQPFSELLNHVKNNKFNKENEPVLPTIFVEGSTDQFYLEQTIINYFPAVIDKLSIKTQSGAGSNWVANQLVAWSHSMFKNTNGDYIKAIGLFDYDDSGRKAKKDLEIKSFTDNQRKTFKSFLLVPKYNETILNFYKKGCKIDVDIEALFDINIMKDAENLQYLESRNPIFVELPRDWSQLEMNATEFLTDKGFSQDELLYLKKVKQFSKEDFLKLIKNQKNIKICLNNFKLLIDDLLVELDIQIE